MTRELTAKEIVEKSYETLVDKGYSPRYTSDECIEFNCNINGIKQRNFVTTRQSTLILSL